MLSKYLLGLSEPTKTNKPVSSRSLIDDIEEAAEDSMIAPASGNLHQRSSVLLQHNHSDEKADEHMGTSRRLESIDSGVRLRPPGLPITANNKSPAADPRLLHPYVPFQAISML